MPNILASKFKGDFIPAAKCTEYQQGREHRRGIPSRATDTSEDFRNDPQPRILGRYLKSPR